MTEIKGNTPEERRLCQIEQWADGNSLHNHIDGNCCPDFSCCNPAFKASYAKRHQFLRLYRVDPRNCLALLGEFLGQALATLTKKKVKIITGLEGQN